MHKYSSNVFWSEEDQCYVAVCPEFPGLSGLADTPEQAIKELQVALELTIEVYEEDHIPLPEPLQLAEANGKVLVRMPKTMHATFLRRAEMEGVSLNTYILTILSEGLGIVKSRSRIEQLLNNLFTGIGGVSLALRASLQIGGIQNHWSTSRISARAAMSELGPVKIANTPTQTVVIGKRA